MSKKSMIYAVKQVVHAKGQAYTYFTFNSQREGVLIWTGTTDRKRLILKLLRMGTKIGESTEPEQYRIAQDELRQQILKRMEGLSGRERYMLQYKIRGEVKRFVWGHFGRPEDEPLPPVKEGDFGVYLTRSPRDGMSERYRDSGKTNFATIIPMRENWRPKGWCSDAPMHVGTEDSCRRFIQLLLMIREHEMLEKRMEQEESRIYEALSKMEECSKDLTDEELAKIYRYLVTGPHDGLSRFEMYKRVEYLL